MINLMKTSIALTLAAVWIHASAIAFSPFAKTEFSPALGEKFTVPFTTTKDGNVTLLIYTPDHNLIRSLSAGAVKAGKEHRIVWDGKDSHGTVVPNEAYIPVLQLQTAEGNYTADPRNTGGEILENLDRHADMQGNIFFTLKQPSRTLVRMGVESGPLLRILSNWQPRSAGKVKIRWNFKDETGSIDFSKLHYIAAISAFALPDFSIITTNNQKESYLHYFERRHLRCNLPQEVTTKMLVRNGRRLSPHFFRCRKEERIPKLSMRMEGAALKNGVALLRNDKPVTVVVQMNQKDLDLIEKKQYEVGFFIDGVFKSEAEQGYIPIRWQFIPNGLKAGEHILTVNITTFDGNVATSSQKFLIKEGNL